MYHKWDRFYSQKIFCVKAKFQSAVESLFLKEIHHFMSMWCYVKTICFSWYDFDQTVSVWIGANREDPVIDKQKQREEGMPFISLFHSYSESCSNIRNVQHAISVPLLPLCFSRRWPAYLGDSLSSHCTRNSVEQLSRSTTQNTVLHCTLCYLHTQWTMKCTHIPTYCISRHKSTVHCRWIDADNPADSISAQNDVLKLFVSCSQQYITQMLTAFKNQNLTFEKLKLVIIYNFLSFLTW